MSEIWETFDDLFQSLNRQERRVTELEIRLARLEKRLQKKEEISLPNNVERFPVMNEMPLERAA